MKAISSSLALLAATSPDTHGFKSNNALTSRHTPLAFVNPTLSRHNSQISNHYSSLSSPTNRRLTPLLSLSRRPEESDNQKPASNDEPHHPLCRLVQNAQTHVEAQMTELFKQIKNPMDLLLDQAAVQSKISRNEAPVIQTALTVAAVKVAAGVLDEDPITPKLVGKELLLAMRVMVSFAPNFFKELGIVSRSPWIDDRISTLVNDHQIDQLVILAAGLDTRAYRLPELDTVSVYELDLPPMVDAKNRLINELEVEQEANIPLSAQSITRIPGNLLESNWTQSIIDAGFDPEKPAIILQEGSIYYFQPEEVDAILSAIRSLSAPGSHLLLDCMTTEGIKQYPFDKFPGQEPTFHTPIDNPKQSFEAQGFNQVEVDKMKEFYFVDAKVE